MVNRSMEVRKKKPIADPATRFIANAMRAVGSGRKLEEETVEGVVSDPSQIQIAMGNIEGEGDTDGLDPTAVDEETDGHGSGYYPDE